MVFFNNSQLELWQCNETEQYNDYGSLIEYTLKTTVSADIQSISPESSMKIFGKILQDTYKVYLDINIPVKDTDIIRIVGEKSTYEILGSPIVNNHVLHHKKLIITKQRVPTQLKQ